MDHSYILLAVPVAFSVWLIAIYKRPHALLMNTILTVAFSAASGSLIEFAGYSLFGLTAFLFGLLVLPIIPAGAAGSSW